MRSHPSAMPREFCDVLVACSRQYQSGSTIRISGVRCSTRRKQSTSSHSRCSGRNIPVAISTSRRISIELGNRNHPVSITSSPARGKYSVSGAMVTVVSFDTSYVVSSRHDTGSSSPPRSRRKSVAMHATSGRSVAAAICRSSLPFVHRSSWSSSAIHAPVAARIPVLRAAQTPRFSWRITRAPHASATATVASVDPSSTTMISCAAYVCAAALAIVSAMNDAAL